VTPAARRWLILALGTTALATGRMDQRFPLGPLIVVERR
jgi:hypothetical protein